MRIIGSLFRSNSLASITGQSYLADQVIDQPRESPLCTTSSGSNGSFVDYRQSYLPKLDIVKTSVRRLFLPAIEHLLPAFTKALRSIPPSLAFRRQRPI